MKFGHRIKTIYVKELIDILRDRRTLIAMVVVPIVLYPLLMLGSIQALSLQSEQLQQEEVVILTQTEQDQADVVAWIQADAEVFGALAAYEIATGEMDPPPPGEEPEAPKLLRADVRCCVTPEDMEQAIKARQAQLGVVMQERNAENPMTRQWLVHTYGDPEDIRSAMTERRFREVLERRDEWIKLSRLQQRGVPSILIRPFRIEQHEVTTPGSILGQILPLILVLMTITGAIYPAIDLTAGERERGTLETLMVCPVPVADLVAGKFLVVTTVALMGAALNLASVSATVYFGGFESVVNAPGNEGFPLAALPLILLSLVPFAILMSAIMIAVCSYARTFKEAQNYVTPVILAVLIPGGIAAFPATRLEGVMLVMPVGNMVLLTRELLLGSVLSAATVVWVLLSTTLYAAAAVAVASKVFGTESVAFSDTASIKSAFQRRLIRPAPRPTLTMAALVVALLFPTWFYVQSRVQADGEAAATLQRTLQLMPVFFILLPLAVCAYFKVNAIRTFALGRPTARHLAAGILLGLTAWVPAHELAVIQQWIIPLPEGLEAADEVMRSAMAQSPPWVALLLLAVMPAVSEEALFRGFLLSGLRGATGKWTALLLTAGAFGVFHFYIFKFPVTALLGLVLGYVCWQSASVWPAVVMHALHNATAVSLALWPGLAGLLNISQDDPSAHLPAAILLPATLLFVLGLFVVRPPHYSLPNSSSASPSAS